MRTVFLTVLIALGLVGCAHKQRAQNIPAPPSFRVGYSETGLASWYGYPYHGRRAANGEVYDMEQMTAAHRTLPFNTWVRVQNLENHRTAEVRINDRGPFVDGRIIDVSRAAARALQFLGPGTARVRFEVIRLPQAATPSLFAVQVGAFQDRKNADRLRSRMARRYGSAQLCLRDGTPRLWRVLVGSEATESAAAELANRIRRDSAENLTAFVVRIDAA
ncbi:MAG TPA: septal ring lytic transglycosylase RlpA family protein [Bryobacteraceae bacterium]|nr:septal ring lytic transglycosylase RlpA family protein [Bryobacteraceae bacterium]